MAAVGTMLIRRGYSTQLAALNKEFQSEPGTLICDLSRLDIRVRLSSTVDLDKYKRLLQERNIPFVDGPRKRLKTRRIVIKGLDPQMDSSYIQEDLESLGHRVLKVSNMISARTKGPLPMFTAVLVDESTVREAFNISTLCFHKVKVVEYRRMQKSKETRAAQSPPAQDNKKSKNKYHVPSPAVPVELAPAVGKKRTAPVEPAAPAPVHPKKTKKKSKASQTEDQGQVEINQGPQNVSVSTQTAPEIEILPPQRADKKCQTSLNPIMEDKMISTKPTCLCWDNCPTYADDTNTNLMHTFGKIVDRLYSKKRSGSTNLTLTLRWDNNGQYDGWDLSLSEQKSQQKDTIRPSERHSQEEEFKRPPSRQSKPREKYYPPPTRSRQNSIEDPCASKKEWIQPREKYYPPPIRSRQNSIEDKEWSRSE